MNAEEIRKLVEDNDSLRKENSFLKQILAEHNINYPESKSKVETLSPSDKLAVYMDYFKGETDYYAERWKNGKGYSPKCLNRFDHEVCDTEKYRNCTNCPNRRFVPLTADIVKKHIQGYFVAGIYPLLKDNTCFFIAVDFDEETWQEDVLMYKKICQNYGIDCLIERSRSGNGAHAWIFFEEKIEAKVVRKVVASFINEASNEGGKLSFKSYDRMFPAQDVKDVDGMGNLIALPLQGESGKQGNTLFVDDAFNSFDNQFSVLKKTKKVSKEDIYSIYEKVKKTEDLGPLGESIKKMKLSKGDFLGEVQLVFDSTIYIEKSCLRPKAIAYFKRMASFLNPEYYRKKNMRFSTYNTPRVITVFQESDEILYLPRGCYSDAIESLDDVGVKYHVEDLRNNGHFLGVNFFGILKAEQQAALDEIIKHDNGILVAPTGFGKTVVAAALIAHHKVNTLVLVNNVNLCQQWRESLSHFLQTERIGEIHSTKKNITNEIDIALIQSISSNEELKQLSHNYGMVICDEVHHLAAVSYEEVAQSLNSKYVYGLTATPKRSDELEKVNFLTVGKIIYEHKPDLLNQGMDKILIPRFTRFKPCLDLGTEDIIQLYERLYKDESRNSLIISDIAESIRNNKKILVLTQRVEHIAMLEKEIRKYTENVLTVYGQMNKKEKQVFSEQLNDLDDKTFVIISTGKYIGEGFDEKRLDTLFLTIPFRWKGTLSQYVGRLNRENESKSEVEVYDYIDLGVSVFARMYNERQKGYKELGYRINKTGPINDTFLYDYENYFPKLKEDLLSAKSNVTLIIQYATPSKLNEMLKNISVNHQIILDKKIDNLDVLPNEKRVEGINANIIIIDGRIMWYGGINPFVYKNNDMSIMRIEDEPYSKDLYEQYL